MGHPPSLPKPQEVVSEHMHVLLLTVHVLALVILEFRVFLCFCVSFECVGTYLYP